MINRRAKIVTFGCQMNIHDSERMATILENHGFEIIYGSLNKKADLLDIDYLIINTCTVREKPENRWLAVLNSFVDKKNKPIVAITGCVAQQKQEDLLKEVAIDIVLGVDKEDKVIEAYEKIKAEREIKKNPELLEAEFLNELPTSTLIRKSPSKFAYVMVSKGCNSFCTYCIVPFVRGKEISKPIDSIVEDIKRLHTEKGVEFVNILAQNIAKYGEDIGENFYTLLDKVSEIKGIKRLSFLTSHPRDFDINIIKLMEKRPNISTLLHLPCQHGSNKILKDMNRGYTREDYLKIIDAVYTSKIASQINLTTDIIIGFPGETDQDFKELMSLLKLVRFDNSFSFIYSPRPGTVAYKKYGHKYSSKDLRKIYTDRLTEYQTLQKQIADEKNKNYIGKTDTLFVENIKENILTGRLHNGKLIHVKNLNNIKTSNVFTKVKITDSHPTFLEGETVT